VEQVANPKPTTHFVARRPSQVEKSKDSVQVPNDKIDAQVENGKPEISDDSKPVETQNTEESSGIREATPAEAAAFRNAVSIFTPAPTKNSNPAGASPQVNIRDLLIAMTVVALGSVALVALFLKAGRTQVESESDTEAEQFEFVPIDASLAPPLQPNSNDEHQFVMPNLPEFLKREQVQD
jgi:hypothetical protein